MLFFAFMKMNRLFLFALFVFISFFLYAADDVDGFSIEDREIEPLPQTDARINGYREDYKKPKVNLIQLPEKYRKKEKKNKSETTKPLKTEQVSKPAVAETEPLQNVQPEPEKPQTGKKTEVKPQEKPVPGYYGETVNGIREGKGRLVTENSDFYDGEWKNGKKHGHGIYIYSNGVKYNGTWNNDRMDGYGSLIFPNGSSYYGEFRDGAITGNGTFKYTDKAEYSGGWKNGKWHGRGCFKLANGKEINAVFDNQQIVEFIKDDEDSE